MIGWRLGRAGQLSGAALALVLTAGAVSAEDRASPMQFWLQNAQPSLVHPAQPAHPTFRPRGATVSSAQRTNRHRAPTVVSPSFSDDDFVVAVFGDSLAQDVVRGLTAAYRAKTGSSILDATSEDATLTQDDPATWRESLDNALRKAGHLDAAVMLVGGSDDDSIDDGSGRSVPVGSPDGRRLYGERVERITQSFKDKRVPLIWVGLPVVRDGEQARAYADSNAVLREHAEKVGATYIDSWDVFTNEAGQYDPFGPDINGKIVRLRRGDGQHFTDAGAQKLASFLEPDLKREMDRVQAGRQLARLNADDHALFDQALEVDINAQIRREAGLPAGSPSTPPQPKDFPVIELTAAPRAADGRLATLVVPLPVAAEIGTAFARGEMPPPRPGRTDDFTWPAP